MTGIKERGAARSELISNGPHLPLLVGFVHHQLHRCIGDSRRKPLRTSDQACRPDPRSSKDGTRLTTVLPASVDVCTGFHPGHVHSRSSPDTKMSWPSKEGFVARQKSCDMTGEVKIGGQSQSTAENPFLSAPGANAPKRVQAPRPHSRFEAQGLAELRLRHAGPRFAP